MKKAVVFKSVLGTTEHYARTLAEKIGADVYRWYIVTKQGLAKYDLVVICTGPYEDWSPLSEFLTRNWEVLKDQTLIVVGVGEIPTDKKKGIRWSPQDRISKNMIDKIKFFELPGKLNPETADQVKDKNIDPIAEYIKEVEKK